MLRRIANCSTGTPRSISGPKPSGFPLREPNGCLIGEVSSVAICDNRLRLAGWAPAARLELRLDDAETSARPHILREDIAARLGIDPRVGFELDIPLAAGAPRGEASLTLVMDGPAPCPRHGTARPSRP